MIETEALFNVAQLVPTVMYQDAFPALLMQQDENNMNLGSRALNRNPMYLYSMHSRVTLTLLCIYASQSCIFMFLRYAS